MMGQEFMLGQQLFENPRAQYALFNITTLDEETAALGHPDDYDNDAATQEQLDAIDAVAKAYPEKAITFDEACQLWIIGAEEDLNRMFEARDAFLDALESGEDPGV